ncbi:unnamed protein product, partial [Larinioides sclopetarius]
MMSTIAIGRFFLQAIYLKGFYFPKIQAKNQWIRNPFEDYGMEMK